jgi:cytochrome P450
MGPDITEAIFLDSHDAFPKPPLEARVFQDPLGNSVLTAQGEAWRWQRKAVAPLFRPRDILDLVPRMAAPAERVVAAWSRAGILHDHPVDRDVTEATYGAISDTLFGGMALNESLKIRSAVATYLNAAPWEIVSALMRRPAHAWHPGRPRLEAATRDMRSAITSLYGRWSEAGGDGQHLLSHLVAARDKGEPMSEAQILNNLITFLNAGHETTAKAITWTLYVLARHPVWQEAVRREVAEVVGQAPIAPEHIDGLRLTRLVIEEAMRLYAPAPVLTRLATRDIEIGGHHIAAETLVFIPIWAIHRHKRLWDDPDRFDPMRFLPARRASYRRTQYMPFGFGPRICIGATFAMVEAVVMLAAMLRGARLAWNGREAPEPLGRVTLWPRGGMRLDVVPEALAQRRRRRADGSAMSTSCSSPAP